LILASQAGVNEVPPLDNLAVGTALTNAQWAQIGKLMDAPAAGPGLSLQIDDGRSVGAGEDFGLVVEDEAPAAPTPVEIQEGPPPLPSELPPPVLPAGIEHPLQQTYQVDAWMPEQIAVMKLQGFVKEVGGEIIQSVPGYIRVHLFDQQDLIKPPSPRLLGWLGLAEQPPAVPRLAAIMELHLIHKPTPTRQLIGITLRLVPGPDQEASPRWQPYCDKVFCELRGFLIGFA
jgi:hypothetical protein